MLCFAAFNVVFSKAKNVLCLSLRLLFEALMSSVVLTLFLFCLGAH